MRFFEYYLQTLAQGCQEQTYGQAQTLNAKSQTRMSAMPQSLLTA